MRRAWRRFWLCHRPDFSTVPPAPMCLGRRWHKGTCGFKGFELAEWSEDEDREPRRTFVLHVEQPWSRDLYDEVFVTDPGELRDMIDRQTRR